MLILRIFRRFCPFGQFCQIPILIKLFHLTSAPSSAHSHHFRSGSMVPFHRWFGLPLFFISSTFVSFPDVFILATACMAMPLQSFPSQHLQCQLHVFYLSYFFISMMYLKADFHAVSQHFHFATAYFLQQTPRDGPHLTFMLDSNRIGRIAVL